MAAIEWNRKNQQLDYPKYWFGFQTFTLKFTNETKLGNLIFELNGSCDWAEPLRGQRKRHETTRLLDWPCHRDSFLCCCCFFSFLFHCFFSRSFPFSFSFSTSDATIDGRSTGCLGPSRIHRLFRYFRSLNCPRRFPTARQGPRKCRELKKNRWNSVKFLALFYFFFSRGAEGGMVLFLFFGLAFSMSHFSNLSNEKKSETRFSGSLKNKKKTKTR